MAFVQRRIPRAAALAALAAAAARGAAGYRGWGSDGLAAAGPASAAKEHRKAGFFQSVADWLPLARATDSKAAKVDKEDEKDVHRQNHGSLLDMEDKMRGHGHSHGSHDGHGSHGGPTVSVQRVLVDMDKQGNHKTPGVALEMSDRGMTIKMEAIKIKGGLFQSFSLNGRNILLMRDDMHQMDGSIFWPSPQSTWDWPPPVAIDPTVHKNFTIAYDLVVDEIGKTFELVSPVWEEHELTVSKKVSVDTSRMSFFIQYSIQTSGMTAEKWAPWEVSRVDPYGLTFFRTGLNETCGTYKPLHLERIDGVTWFQHVGDRGQGNKLFASTRAPHPLSRMAWLAHTDGHLVYVKCFFLIPQGTEAPDEGQVEVYDGEDYVEVENQGAYQDVFPGQPITWTVEWFLREMPAGAKAVPGDATLVQFADRLCH